MHRARLRVTRHPFVREKCRLKLAKTKNRNSRELLFFPHHAGKTRRVRGRAALSGKHRDRPSQAVLEA